MNFLKNLFGGGGSPQDKSAFFVYVRPKRCDQIVEVRINIYNELSLNDLGDGYFIRKMAQAARCPFAAEMTLYFDKNRNFKGGDVENGELVSTEEYEQWLTAKEAN